jgi:TP901 family phage tail tape measure protein
MATNTEKIVVQVIVKGGKQLDNLDGKTKKATKSVGGLTKSMIKMAGGIAIAVSAFRAITSAVRFSIRTFRDFEFQMAKVRAVSGATDSDFKKLTNTAKALGRSTFFTANQVAALQTNYAKLGFTTSEILKAQEATLLLATATGSDLARAAIVAGAAVRGFGLDASETDRVVDVMAVTFASSAMDIEKWQTSMTKVAPIAKSAGFSIEDTAAIMAQLTDAGIEASIAGTSFRNILLKMQDPASDLTKSFGKTIHSFDELVPAMKKFVEDGGSMADVLEVVDLRQAAAFEQMVTSAEKTTTLRDRLLEASGAAKEMADIVGDNMEGAMKRFTSALEGLAISIMDGFIGKAITNILGGITSIISAINEFSDDSASLSEITATAAGAFLKEGIALQNLADRYDTLNDKISKNTSDRIEMEAILDTLKTKLGDSVVAINEETGALQLNRDALDDVIARTALLADDEAIKLVHSIRNIDKAIGKQTKTLDSNSKSLTKQKRLLLEKQKTQDDVTKSNLTYSQSTRQMTDEEGELISGRFEGNVVNKETAEQEIVINKLKVIGNNLTSEITAKEVERKKQLDLLLDAGFDMAKVERLLGQEIEKTTQKTNTSTESNKASIKVKEQSLELEREMVELLMADGAKSTEDAARIQEYLNGLREKEIELQLKSLNQFVMDVDLRKKLLLELEALKAGVDVDDQERKEESFKSDVKRAIMSGQSAEEAMKTVVRAQIMEAVAGHIASIFTSVPFPFNLILAAGAAGVVGGLIDGALAKFGNGGIVETFANGGMVHGKSHAQGGEKFAVGGRVVELEGGEAVMNKRSTAMFSNQLSAMNQAGGGVKFADGGLLNSPSFSQQQFNALGQNQMMGAMGNSGKVVVVEADITNSQNTVSVIQSQATI